MTWTQVNEGWVQHVDVYIPESAAPRIGDMMRVRICGQEREGKVTSVRTFIKGEVSVTISAPYEIEVLL